MMMVNEAYLTMTMIYAMAWMEMDNMRKTTRLKNAKARSIR
jgi:hypothetical protein